jgi:2-hydroxy-3-oxopropionate reductase
MGMPMARNLLRAGYELIVYNRSQAAVDRLADSSVTVAENLREVVASTRIVITMLPGPIEVKEVIDGADGLLQQPQENLLIIDMSTSSPELAKELDHKARRQGASIVDAPVSGADVGAQAGTLSIMAGGSKQDFDRAMPLFDVLGNTIVHVGSSGAGQVVKACNQIVVAIIIEAVSEALTLGDKAGVDGAKVIEALSGGLAETAVLNVKASNFLNHNFEPGGKVSSHYKDLGIALDTGRRNGAPLPLTAMVEQMFCGLKAKGMGDSDHSALLSFLEGWSRPNVS